jgi:hypothetical protein
VVLLVEARIHSDENHAMAVSVNAPFYTLPGTVPPEDRRSRMERIRFDVPIDRTRA